MPTYARGPRLVKGAIVALDPTTHQTTPVVFQYNPESVRRSLQPQMAGGDQQQYSYAVRFTGAPVETIDVEVAIEAVDQLERGDGSTAARGIYPQLALLELLVYPASRQVVTNNTLLDLGTLEIAPLPAPLALFIWGPNRVLPVRINNMSITEELFDARLNPLRATLQLNLRALSYSDLDRTTPGYNLFLTYQQTKEAQALEAISGGPNVDLGVNTNQIAAGA